MLGKVVGAVRLAFAPVNLELALADAIPNPIEAHVDRFRAFLFHSVRGNATRSAIVSGHWRCGLGVPHFFEGDAQWTGLLPVME